VSITAAFLRLAGHNLANYGPLSNDEGELMAIGYKLATRGVLGSDMYAGFYGGDQHALETLPLQAVFQAISFRFLGAGVAQARLVSLLSAMVILWVVGWLALRWYGLLAAVVCEVLLVAWRSNLTAASDGLPLLGVARTARYDVLAVAAAWLAIGALDAYLRRPGVLPGLLAGICAGLAALATFFGAFVLPMLLLGLVLTRRRGRRTPRPWWILAGFGLVVAPFGVYAAHFASDLAGQLGVYGDRGDFLSRDFWLNNLSTEPARYAHLLAGWPPGLDASGADVSGAPISPWLLVLGIGPAVAYVAWQARREDATGHRLVIASVVCFGGLLQLVDQTKAPLYAIVLLPSICLCLAAALAAMLRWTWRETPHAWSPRALGLVGASALFVVIAVEGVHAYAVDWEAAASVTPYLPLGGLIDAATTPGAPVLGPERYWWALHAHPYTSLRSIWFQWSAAAKSGSRPDFTDWVVGVDPDSIVVNINVRSDIEAFPVTLQNQFWSYLARCTVLTTDIDNPNYFDTAVYRVTPGCR
jgi:4-amino-4-deoxy-L-arabinose transferase-like glycosyltransferase